MELTVNRKDLIKALQVTSRVVKNNATLESLQGVLIKVEGNVVSITSTNLEVALQYTIPVSNTKDGEVLVNPKVLLDAVRFDKNDTITLNLTNDILTVNSKTSSTKLKILNKADFPVIKRGEDNLKDTIKISVEGFIKGIKSVIYAVSHSIIKPELASVYIWNEEQNLVFVATDSFRLAEKKIKQKDVSLDDLSILIPQKNTQDLLAVLDLIKEDIEELNMVVGKDQLVIFTDDIYISLRTINGAFPDYKKIIPSDHVATITVLKNDLSDIVKKAGIFSDKFSKIKIKIDSNNKKVLVNTQNGELGETNNELSAVIEGEDAQISVNYKYLIDGLANINVDSVVVSLFGQGKPVVLTGVGDKTFTYLVMPMNN